MVHIFSFCLLDCFLAWLSFSLIALDCQLHRSYGPFVLVFFVGEALILPCCSFILVYWGLEAAEWEGNFEFGLSHFLIVNYFAPMDIISLFFFCERNLHPALLFSIYGSVIGVRIFRRIQFLLEPDQIFFFWKVGSGEPEPGAATPVTAPVNLNPAPQRRSLAINFRWSARTLWKGTNWNYLPPNTNCTGSPTKYNKQGCGYGWSWSGSLICLATYNPQT